MSLNRNRYRLPFSSLVRTSCLACLLLFSLAADATTVLAANLEQILSGSALVFEGRVVSVESRQSSESPMIYTYITFTVLDVIHGQYGEDTIELRFLGGALADGRGMSVSEMNYPEVGEEGIYFVESLERMQVHPLYGWSQGHLLVQRDSQGVRRVTTQGGQPITGVKPGEGKEPGKRSTGAAEGLELGTAADLGAGLAVLEFKQRLREMAP